jgi:polyisoprenoid-binding protein YceI
MSDTTDSLATAEDNPLPVAEPAEEAAVTEGEAPATETAPADGAVTTTDTAPQEAANEAAVAESATPVIFEIVPEESTTSFIIDEVLNGSPKTVVGTTGQVAGQIAIDLTNPANSQVGVIQVNARTLTTDNQMRNRAIMNRILFTDDYEYVTFTPTELVGLPETVAVGESFSFQMTGDLTVRDTTQQVTFDVQVTPVDEGRLEGFASTTILYADFGISIPNVPSVTGVSDQVALEIDFVAEQV